MLTKISRHKTILQKARSFLWNHRIDILQLTVFAAFVVVPHSVGFANDINSNMPWDKGINTLQSALTGPIPRAGAAISVATAAGLWMFGESQITKVGMRVALGSGIALSAPTAVSALSGVTVSGCLF
ncbi:MAG: TrbC/VirB2 family protein [Smithella sp.]